MPAGPTNSSKPGWAITSPTGGNWCSGSTSGAGGKPYTSVLLDDRFARLRNRARVRPGITPYSFRHLWISEMLMAGVDVLLVARMAGTSVAMGERVYGHFRNQSYQEAQARLDRERAARAI
jgi:integrase